MGMRPEKMYGSYSDADLNDWERFPMNASVLTSSAFGAWLLRRDERRYAAIKADYETRLKADMVVMLTELQLEIERTYLLDLSDENNVDEYEDFAHNRLVEGIISLIRQKIDNLKEDQK